MLAQSLRGSSILYPGLIPSPLWDRPVRGRMPLSAPRKSFVEENGMNAQYRKVAVALAIVLVGMALTLQAKAECGKLDAMKPGASFHPQSLEGGNYFGPASLLTVSDQGDNSIVGMWK